MANAPSLRQFRAQSMRRKPVSSKYNSEKKVGAQRPWTLRPRGSLRGRWEFRVARP